MKNTEARRFLVGTVDGLHLLGREAATLWKGRRVTTLARGGSRWWTLLDGREIHSSTDARAWRTEGALEGLAAHCLLPLPDAVWIGASEASLFRLVEGAPQRVEAFDRAPGRKDWYTPWGAPPDTRSLSAGADGALYVNVHVGGVLKSTDGGRTWKQTIDVDHDVHEVQTHPRDPGLVVVACGAGLAWSRDGAASWTMETRGFHARYQRAVAFAGESLLVSCSRSERGERSAVYRRPLPPAGQAERCRGGLPEWFSGNINTGCLAAHDGVVGIGDPDGSVFVSADEGTTWEVLKRGLPRITCLAID